MKFSKKLLNAFFYLIIIGAGLVELNIFRNLIVGNQSVIHNNSLHEEEQKIRRELTELNEKRAKLSREIRLLKTDPSYVEKIIRQRLNYVYKDEILYLFDKEEVNPSE